MPLNIGTGKNSSKTVVVAIKSLKITSEDKWLAKWIKVHGAGVIQSPQYYYLRGFGSPMVNWMRYRKLPEDYLAGKLIKTMQSIQQVGQLIPIKIYADKRINTGHKRAAAMLFLGHRTIKAVVVPDNYKL